MSIDVYSVGILIACACAPNGTPPAEIEAAVSKYLNATSPAIVGETGFHAKLADDETFATGQPNPCPCDQSPDRTHYLLDY